MRCVGSQQGICPVPERAWRHCECWPGDGAMMGSRRWWRNWAIWASRCEMLPGPPGSRRSVYASGARERRAHGGNRERVATLVAFCEMVRRDHRIDNVAGWLETPVSPEAPVTGMDLVANDRFDLVLHLAAGGGDDAEAVLEEFDPGWRVRYASDAEVFAAPDGLPGLRLRHATS